MSHFLITKQRRLFFVILNIVASVSASFTLAQESPKNVADSLEPVKTERPSFAYEQCYNGCRQRFDQALTLCLNRRDANKDGGSAKCIESARHEFKLALTRCPTDTGRRKHQE